MMCNRWLLGLAGAMILAVLTAQARDEIAALAQYRAEQSGKKLTVFAEGKNNTGGWKNEITAQPTDVVPPEFKFTQTAPDGVATQAITPFAVKVTVDAGDKLTHVFVHDKAGKHKVAVKQLP